ncbi:MAG: ribonuclease H-like domain-containing protein [Bacillota bacterium]|nr:ribonuclease H-like domain-containing protein [Bacillota bacterium]
MIKQTFLHLSGIGEKTESNYWNRGINNWDDLENSLSSSVISKNSPILKNQIALSRKSFEKTEVSYFSKRLPVNQQWRLFADFNHAAAYLDIETTGLGNYEDHVTTISLYDGKKLSYYVWGDNLEQFVEDIRDYSLLITYNGKCFDLPFLERQFRIKLDQAHLDLRFVLARLGYKGGLKGCERQLGIDRGDLEGVDGFMAVLLWREYQRSGNVQALETLLSYNMEDTINLERLAFLSYNQFIAFTPFREEQLPLPANITDIPFKPTREIIERLQYGLRRNGYAG